MKLLTVITTICCLSAYQCSLLLPLPGSLEASISVPSLSNIVGLLAGVLPSYLANNKTLDLNYTQKGLGYNIFISDLHINTLNINTRQISMVPGTDILRVYLSGINLNSDVNGTMTLMGIIPLQAAKLNITNLTIQIDLEAVPYVNNSVKWQLKESSVINLTDITINTTNPIWNFVIYQFHGVIKNLVVSFLPQISQDLTALVNELNLNLLNGTSFLVDVFDNHFPLNLTTTQIPTANNVSDVITINFDGTFYDNVTKTNWVEPNTNQPNRINDLNSNQFFIHQTMVSSLFIAIENDLFPITLNDTVTVDLVLQLFPEIKYKYGPHI